MVSDPGGSQQIAESLTQVKIHPKAKVQVAPALSPPKAHHYSGQWMVSQKFVFHEFSGSKVDERVEFPLEGLDLAPFVSGPKPQAAESLLYDLHAYICHIGGACLTAFL
ncbi:hypothetical protein HPB51_019008 [Rhipicephalus microplus]|uniref:Peptidase C19 ubiquitin carboxyl-terminal hydrolase domain-containing protein n=1 Tax=Rhipicephalus microplus TaxID=6941 RepID=A0A9J6D6J8_RHIMP|nr:hypothetical protein HPB51_019008 [Rhipicephalus microplus]